MSSSVDSRESHTVSLLQVSTDLTIDLPRVVGSSDVPVKLSDPLASTLGGDGTVLISGILKHPELASILLPDPLGSLYVVSLVGKVVSTVTKVPCGDSSVDMESSLDVSSVKVCNKRVSEHARRQIRHSLGLLRLSARESPRGVVFVRGNLLVSGKASISLSNSDLRSLVH